LRLNSLRVVSAKPSEIGSKAGGVTGQSRSTGSPQSSHANQNSVLKEDRRRSQRVLLRIRANIHVALQGRQESFEVTTLSVNHHGALVIMKQNLPLNTRLVLENAHTRERVACKVVRPPREIPEGFQVPIEFDSPAPDFWRIAFPPSDWRPDEQ